MQIELRFFANFRAVVGQKVLEWEYDAEEVPVGRVLEDLVDEYPDLELFTETGDLRDFLSILRNGRDIEVLEGLDTLLEDDDKLSIFPPVAGG